MKHLKTYKVFESIDRQTIKDIFLDLEDIGFLIETLDKFKIGKSKSDVGLSTYGQFYHKDLNSELNLKNKFKKDFICVKITKHWPNIKFEWNEVEDYIKRLIDFLENTSETAYKFYQINIYKYNKSGTFPLKELTDIFCDNISKEFQEIEGVEVYFEKI